MQKLGLEIPIFQAGMIWVSGAKLASACANTGALGVIGAASMSPELLKIQIAKAQSLTSKPLAVNVPLLYRRTEEQLEVALEAGIRIFITSAGSPKKHTQRLKDQGAVVIHVVSSPVLARKCEDAGVDMVVAEGFEAGGHNGREEITTMVLVPQVVQAVKIPVIAAGGIATGGQMAACFAMGASAVQVGSRFVACEESSAHPKFQDQVCLVESKDTVLCLKQLVPVRLIKNKFCQEILEMENSCADSDRLSSHLGKGRARLGMHEGDMDEGELEIGQACGLIQEILSAKNVVSGMMNEYKMSVSQFSHGT